MKDLQIFNNNEFGEIQILEEKGKFEFEATGMAKILGYVNPYDAIQRHCKKDGVVKHEVIDNLGRKQEKNFISEGNLYRLITHSILPDAEKFESWVFDEVLPSIRKHGGYIAGQENMTEDEIMARAILYANSKIKELETKNDKLKIENSQLVVSNEIMKPKAEYFDDLVDRNLLTGFRETAKALGIKPKKFMEFLIENKYIYRDKKGKPQPYSNKNNGLFELKESKNDKTGWAGTQTMITPKGRETFRLLCIGI